MAALQDTVFAPATPVGGAIAVIRVSGPGATAAAKAITGKTTFVPRRMCHGMLSYQGMPLDDAMYCCFAAPHSYTGEDMLELYCHGGSAVVQGVLSALSALGLTPAAPGEFTRRAFVNGKLDLAQAEAVMDTIQATASAAKNAALLQMQGVLSEQVEHAERLLLDGESAIGAAIDYPDEVEQEVTDTLPEALSEAETLLSGLIEQGRRGRVLREGLRCVLLGRPNAGKSSLYNALLGQRRAIVTGEAGTTRDTIEEAAILLGVPLRLVDTAGLREAAGEAEREGVLRSREAMETADVCLLLFDAAEPLTNEDAALLAETKEKRRLVLLNKSDLPPVLSDAALRESMLPGEPLYHLSAKTGEGIEELKAAIVAGIDTGESVYVTNERHIRALEQALTSLRQAKDALPISGLDCASMDIRDALTHLGEITGRDVDAAVIDRIFERFCVGK
ncbi:MAG: tRNA uridine-5-carboxymethylaminomethyl(34) synthesis GTPase MnmE [Eubacteriales bacterium]|nr:tRNA uridine-5-carboxymethylaminomethyl(34) synthesis GTPase MnmE [Eubacteriales bacterium]